VPAADGARRRSQVDGNVYALGFTSMFTDISSEMVGAVLPLYLTLRLGFTPLQFGAFDGVYQVVAAIAALATARLADRTFRHKAVATIGYGMSASCRLGFLVAGGSWAPATALLWTDRAGKGIRTAPRDAIISLSSAPGRLAHSFGVHRALDTTGALAGPLLAYILLRTTPGSYDAVFMVSFCAAVIGLAVLALYVRSPARHSRRRTVAAKLGPRSLLRWRGYRLALCAAVLLGCFKVSDALVYLTFERRTSLRLEYFPLLYVGTAIVYMALAVPMGRAADALGRARVFLFGFVSLAGAYLLLARTDGALALLAMLTLLGLFYACTDGVLAAIVTSALPADVRTTGLAVVNTVVAVGGFFSSVTFGALWSWRGPQYAVGAFTLGLVVALCVTGPALLRYHAAGLSIPSADQSAQA
jgi:MFS family permease